VKNYDQGKGGDGIEINTTTGVRKRERRKNTKREEIKECNSVLGI